MWEINSLFCFYPSIHLIFTFKIIESSAYHPNEFAYAKKDQLKTA